MTVWNLDWVQMESHFTSAKAHVVYISWTSSYWIPIRSGYFLVIIHKSLVLMQICSINTARELKHLSSAPNILINKFE